MVRKLGTASGALISGKYLVGRSSNDAAKIGLAHLAVAPGPTRPLTVNERSPSLSTESLVWLSRPRDRPWASTSYPASCLKQTSRRVAAETPAAERDKQGDGGVRNGMAPQPFPRLYVRTDRFHLVSAKPEQQSKVHPTHGGSLKSTNVKLLTDSCFQPCSALTITQPPR